MKKGVELSYVEMALVAAPVFIISNYTKGSPTTAALDAFAAVGAYAGMKATYTGIKSCKPNPNRING